MKGILKLIKKIKEAKNKRLFYFELFCVLLLLITIGRLAWMQFSKPDVSYKDYFEQVFATQDFDKIKGDTEAAKSETFWMGTTITDRNGSVIVADDFRAAVSTTSAMEKLSYRQIRNCAKDDEGEKLFSGWFEKNYKPSCNKLIEQNREKRLAFIDNFMKENDSIFGESAKSRKRTKKDGSTSYIDLDISEYQQLQTNLAERKKIRDQIAGFKFDFYLSSSSLKSNTLKEICLTNTWEDPYKNIKTGNIYIPDAEKDRWNDSEKDEYEKIKETKITDYCSGKSEKVALGLVLTEIFENNKFTSEMIESIEKSLTSDERTKILEGNNFFDIKRLKLNDADRELLTKRKDSEVGQIKDILDGKTYRMDGVGKTCSGEFGANYSSVFCKKMYERNLDSILEFFKNKSQFKDFETIRKSIEQAKKTYPNDSLKVVLSNKDKAKNLKEALEADHKSIANLSDYLIFLVKSKPEDKKNSPYSRKAEVSVSSPTATLFLNKKQIRQFSLTKNFFTGKTYLKKLYGTAKAKAQDEQYREYVEKIKKAYDGVDIPEERNYIPLAELDGKDFHALLPEISYFDGTYFMDGLEFEKNPRYRTVLAGTHFYKNEKKNDKSSIPEQYELKPQDYVLAQLLGIGTYSVDDKEHPGESKEYPVNGIEKCYLQENHDNQNNKGRKYLDSSIASAVPSLKDYQDKEVLQVKLTIDSKLQNYAEMLLRKQGLENVKAEKGVAIVQNVNTGELLAVAAYNPNWRPGYSIDMLNFVYQPGSVMKPITIASLLDLGLKDISDGSSYKLDGKCDEFTSNASPTKEIWKMIRDHGRDTCYQVKKDEYINKKNMYKDKLYSLEYIIAESSNFGTAYAANIIWDMNNVKDRKGNVWKTGQEYMKNMRSNFGFGVRTGMGASICAPELCGNNAPIDGDKVKNTPASERSKCGVFASDNPINLVDYLKDAYGQGTTDVTPLQMVNAYSALVNGGTLYKPYIVKEVTFAEGTGSITVPIPSQTLHKDIISEATSKTIRKYMKAVFKYGTGKSVLKNKNGKGFVLKDENGEFLIGGKTGTADKYGCPDGKICYPYQCDFIGDTKCADGMSKEECYDQKLKKLDTLGVSKCPSGMSKKDCFVLKQKSLASICRISKVSPSKEERCDENGKCPKKACDKLEKEQFKQQENNQLTADVKEALKKENDNFLAYCKDNDKKFSEIVRKINNEKIDKQGNLTKTTRANRSSFIAFLPYDNPQYVIYVMYDESKDTAAGGNRQGSGAAGPVIKELAEYIQENMLSAQGYGSR